jgi:transposase
LTKNSRAARGKPAQQKKKNPYAARAKISQPKLRQLVRYFAIDLNATQIAQLTNLNRNTVNRYVRAIRERIATSSCGESGCAAQQPPATGFVFARRFKLPGRAERTRGTAVFHVFLHGERICTQVAETYVVDELLAVSRGKIKCDRMIYLDTCLLESLTGPGTAARQRAGELEAFWAFLRTRLAKFRGTSGRTFELHLKECEFRFNRRQQDMRKTILRSLRDEPLF